MEEGYRRRDDRGRGLARDAGRVGARATAIVPAYLAEDTIAATLHSLVVDNGPTLERVIVVVSPGDATAAKARRFPTVEVFEAQERLTAGAARNLGRLLAGDTGLLLFVDADCRLTTGAVAKLRDAVAERSLAAAGAAILRDGGGVVARLRHLLEFKDSEPGVISSAFPFLASTALLVRTDAFDRVGGFPDLYPGEDLVLGHRLAALGLAQAKIDEAVVFHRHPRGLGRLLRHQYRLGLTSAQARAMTGMHGVHFVGRPWLLPVLFAGRALRAAVWMLHYRPREAPLFVAMLPLYLAGLGAWTLGFARGGRA